LTTRSLDLALLFPTDTPLAGEGVGWVSAFRTLWQPFAPLTDPNFLGDPKAPTQPFGDNDTSIATTAFVQAAVVGGTSGVASFNTRVGAVVLTSVDVTNVLPPASTLPQMDGVAAIGAAGKWAQSDHVHPVDTSRYAASNPSDYQTAAQVAATVGAAVPAAATVAPLMAGVAAVGVAAKYAREDHIHPSDTNMTVDAGTY
jgi:hypothetical protein